MILFALLTNGDCCLTISPGLEYEAQVPLRGPVPLASMSLFAFSTNGECFSTILPGLEYEANVDSVVLE